MVYEPELTLSEVKFVQYLKRNLRSHKKVVYNDRRSEHYKNIKV